LCECTADCPDGSDMCDAGDNGACYSQKITDISGQRNVLRKGCVADAQSVICAYRDSGAHENICCDNKDFCNKEHFIGDYYFVEACLLFAVASYVSLVMTAAKLAMFGFLLNLRAWAVCLCLSVGLFVCVMSITL